MHSGMMLQRMRRIALEQLDLVGADIADCRVHHWSKPSSRELRWSAGILSEGLKKSTLWEA